MAGTCHITTTYELRNVVDVLAGVARVGNDEAELEVEALQQAVAEEVALDHAKVVDRLVADHKLHARAHVSTKIHTIR